MRLLRLSGLVLTLAAALSAATLARYPYLQNLRADRVTVVWTTQGQASGVVLYSTDRSFSAGAKAEVRDFPNSATHLGFDYRQYQAELTGLKPATDYFYKVMVDQVDITADNDLRFRTPGPGKFSFLVFGDSGLGGADQLALAQVMSGENPGLVLHTGDLAYLDGNYQQLENFYFKVYRQLMKRVAFFPTPGNHEYYTALAAPYLSVNVLPTESVPFQDHGRYYSFDYGNAHFISLDSNFFYDAGRTERMIAWLEDDLQRSRQFWQVVYFHHPPYATGPHRGDTEEQAVRDRLVPLFERYGVQLVLNGHEHSYQRTWPMWDGSPAPEGIVYVTTGGGGGPLYDVAPPQAFLAQSCKCYHYLVADVDGGKMSLRVIGLNGQFDAFDLAPAPKLTAVVNAASFAPRIAPGALISIFGQNLAVTESAASSLPLPTSLGGIRLALDGEPLPLLYVSRNQVNAQVPYHALGWLTLSAGPDSLPVKVDPVAPAIFYTSGLLPAVTHANGTLVSAAAPAERDEWISIFLTGLGRLEREIGAGEPGPVPPLSVLAPVQVQLGGRTIAIEPPAFAGLTPRFAGLYQVNAQVPSDLPGGSLELRVVIQGVTSDPASLAVRARPN